MRNSIKAIFIIIGTTIGAGFASGQEIYSFFNIYGENGLLGLIISNVITGFIIYNVLKICNKKNINSYSDLLDKLKVNKKITNIITLIMKIFLLISFYIMVAGFTAYFKQELNIPNSVTAICILILCYITFMKNIDGIAKINSIAIPILIMIVIIMGTKINILNSINTINFGNITFFGNWILKSIEYASYNSILLLPILISIKEYTKNNEKKVSIITGSILFLLSFIIYIMIKQYSDISNVEIPLVYIASKFGAFYKNIYGLVILLAIFTTMIASGYGFLQNCSSNKKTYKILALVICITAVFVSNISFSNLVNLTYPVFGILGLIQLVFILKNMS